MHRTTAKVVCAGSESAHSSQMNGVAGVDI